MMDALALIILVGFAAFILYAVLYVGKEKGRQEEQTRRQQEEQDSWLEHTSAADHHGPEA